MLNKNQFIRNFIYITFCILIIVVGAALTYYLFSNDEINFESKTEKEFFDSYNDEDDGECEDKSLYFGNLFFKFSSAFFVGSMLSDKFFIKLGVI